MLDWPIYVAWAVTVIGWLVTHVLSERREERKESRTEVDACCKLAADLLTKARMYYVEPADSDQALRLGREIRFELQRLCKRAERLQRRCVGFQTDDALDALMETVTGDAFESASRDPVPINSPLLSTIEGACHQLIDALEDGFTRTYQLGYVRQLFQFLQHAPAKV